jgi:hypothetical protein
VSSFENTCTCDIASLEHLLKTETQRYQSFVVINIESPKATGSNVVPAPDAQSRDWLKRRNLCVRASMLAGKGVLPSEDADENASRGDRVKANCSQPSLPFALP